MSSTTNELKDQVAYFMRRLYERKLTTISGGNISYRYKDNFILITPSHTDKGCIQGSEIGVIDLEGNIKGKNFTPSIETQMHLNIFKNRPDISAIVHAHPVIASSLSASEVPINTKYLSESYFILGNIEYANYALMGSDELATKVANSAKQANVIVMKNHGITTLGNNLIQAFDRIEVIENSAKTTLINDFILKDSATEISTANLTILNEM